MYYSNSNVTPCVCLGIFKGGKSPLLYFIRWSLYCPITAGLWSVMWFILTRPQPSIAPTRYLSPMPDTIVSPMVGTVVGFCCVVNASHQVVTSLNLAIVVTIYFPLLVVLFRLPKLYVSLRLFWFLCFKLRKFKSLLY